MIQWLYVAACLLVEAAAARRDACIRFLKAEVETLRRKLGGNRVIPSPADRTRLLAIGQELGHNVADIIGIVMPQTYSRWVAELRDILDLLSWTRAAVPFAGGRGGSLGMPSAAKSMT